MSNFRNFFAGLCIALFSLSVSFSALAFDVDEVEFKDAIEISYSELSHHTDKGDVVAVNIIRYSKIYGVLKSGRKFIAEVPGGTTIYDRLVDSGAEVRYAKVIKSTPKNTPFSWFNNLSDSTSLSILMLVIFIAMLVAFIADRNSKKRYEKERAEALDHWFHRLEKLLDKYAER